MAHKVNSKLNPTNVQPQPSFPKVVTPKWLPFDKVTDEYVSTIIREASWPTTKSKAIKYQVVTASFLKAVQEVYFSTVHQGHNNDGTYLGVRFKGEAWSLYPFVGKDIYKKVVLYFLDHFKAVKVAGSGSSNLVLGEDGKWSSDPLMSMYKLDFSRFPDWLPEAKFIEIGLPTIKINKAESRGQRERRKKLDKAKPYYKTTEAQHLFNDAYRASESRLQSLNKYWQQHPLVMQDGHAAACATRVYHDGRMDAGGRLYGAWTNKGKDANGIKIRLYSTIDGEPVCELDVKASQPTLFSSLLGYRLGGLKNGDTWSDVYSEMSSLWATNISWSHHDPLIDQTEQIKRNRPTSKDVVMALIGTGQSMKSNMTDEIKNKHRLTKQGWLYFKEALNQTLPALEMLEPRYDRSGQITGYLNGSGFLSHHESEMMMLTLERLMDLGIPAYPVHDCLIVKVKDSKVASQVFRETISDYCYKMSGLKVLVPLSVDALDTVNHNDLPAREDLLGRYLN